MRRTEACSKQRMLAWHPRLRSKQQAEQSTLRRDLSELSAGGLGSERPWATLTSSEAPRSLFALHLFQELFEAAAAIKSFPELKFEELDLVAVECLCSSKLRAI